MAIRRKVRSDRVEGRPGTRTFGRDDNLPTAVAAISGDNAATFGYSYDDNKNPTAETVAGALEDYAWTAGYDNEDRLTSYDWDTGYSQDWTLTKAGDWDDTTIGSTTYDRSHNSVHELTQLASMGPALTYDSKGNLTADAASQTYEWDFDNLLKKITTSGGTVLDYAYDVYGRRVSRKVTPSMGSATTVAFVLASASEGGQVMAECDPTQSGTVVTRKYIWGSYVDDLLVQIVVGSPEVKYYHHTNRMYSSAAVTDSSGTVVERYAYTAYGEPTILNASGTVLTSSAIGNRWLFTGREWEPEAKVYYYRARYYEPKLGRFLGRDPAEYSGSLPNLYSYTQLSPFRRLDPTGLKCGDCVPNPSDPNAEYHQRITELRITPWMANPDTIDTGFALLDDISLLNDLVSAANIAAAAVQGVGEAIEEIVSNAATEGADLSGLAPKVTKKFINALKKNRGYTVSVRVEFDQCEYCSFWSTITFCDMYDWVSKHRYVPCIEGTNGTYGWMVPGLNERKAPTREELLECMSRALKDKNGWPKPRTK